MVRRGRSSQPRCRVGTSTSTLPSLPGGRSTCCGVLLAANVDVVVPFIESVVGFKFLAKDVYQISDLPSEVRSYDVVVTALFSFIVSMLATIYPSWRASRINPAEALRYE